MRVNYRNLPTGDKDADGSTSPAGKIGKVLGKVASLAVGAYAAKKVGGGLSDVGKGLSDLSESDDE